MRKKGASKAALIKPETIRVEKCNGPLCSGKQASEYSICYVPSLQQQERGVSKYGT